MKTYQALLLCLLCLVMFAVTQLQKRIIERERAANASLVQAVHALSRKPNVAIFRDVNGDVYVKSGKWVFKFDRVCPMREL